jgi:hypothetical protein
VLPQLVAELRAGFPDIIGATPLNKLTADLHVATQLASITRN